MTGGGGSDPVGGGTRTGLDWFSLLGSGVPAGYDEQVFFWTDMLYYRKTFKFAAALWRNA